MTLGERRRVFFSALSTQARVIVALVLRDFTNEVGGSPVTLFLMFARPGMMVGFVFLVSATTHRLEPQGMPLLAFLVTGWLSWFAFHRTFVDISPAETSGSSLLFPQVSPLDVFVANFVFEVFVYTIVFILFVLTALLFERSPFPANPLQVIMAFWCVELLGSSLGLVFNAASRLVPAVTQFNVMIRRAGFLISGVAVTAADTPPAILQYIRWNPLFHCFELMREAWWPAYVSPIADFRYVALFLFFSTSFGLALERFTRRFITD